jgi:hypothetical protein
MLDRKGLNGLISAAFHLPAQIPELTHSVTSPMSFRVEYKRSTSGPVFLQRQIKFQVDISQVNPSSQHNSSVTSPPATLSRGGAGDANMRNSGVKADGLLPNGSHPGSPNAPKPPRLLYALNFVLLSGTNFYVD